MRATSSPRARSARAQLRVEARRSAGRAGPRPRGAVHGALRRALPLDAAARTRLAELRPEIAPETLPPMPVGASNRSAGFVDHDRHPLARAGALQVTLGVDAWFTGKRASSSAAGPTENRAGLPRYRDFRVALRSQHRRPMSLTCLTRSRAFR